MSIYDILDSDRNLLALPAAERLAAVRAKAWTPKPGDQAWVWNMNLISRLGSAGALPLIATVNALADGQAQLPDGLPAGSDLLLKEARNAMRASPGLNLADKETLPMLLLLKASIPDLAATLDTLIGWGWNYSTTLANATLEQVAAAAARIAAEQSVADLEALAAAHWNDVVQPRLSDLRTQAATGTATVPTLAELVGV